MEKTWHIWVQNNETGETRCKIVKTSTFGEAGSIAFELVGHLTVKTGEIWDIMSVNDVNFVYDPKRPLA